MKISRKNNGQRSQPRAVSKNFKQRKPLKSSSIPGVIGQQQVNPNPTPGPKKHAVSSIDVTAASKNESKAQTKQQVKNQHHSAAGIIDCQSFDKSSKGTRNQGSMLHDKQGSSSGTLLAAITQNLDRPYQGGLIQAQLTQQRHSLFGNAAMQQNLMSADTSFNDSAVDIGTTSNVMIKNMNYVNHSQTKAANYAQGNPARMLRKKIQQNRETAVETMEKIIQIQSVGNQGQKRPQSSLPLHHGTIIVQGKNATADRFPSKERIFNSSANVALANQTSNSSGVATGDPFQVIGISQRNSEMNVAQQNSSKHAHQQQFFERRKNIGLSYGGPAQQKNHTSVVSYQHQYNSNHLTSTQSGQHSASGSIQLVGAGGASQSMMMSQASQGLYGKQQSFMMENKKQEGIQMLPSTPKHFKRTKREHFTRRMSMIDRPVLIITFQGVIGDLIQPTFFQKEQPSAKDSDPISQQLSCLNIRIGLIPGMRYLSKNFQVVIINDQEHSILTRGKDMVELINLLFAQHDISIDAIYSINHKLHQVQCGFSQVCEDYSQVFVDFNLNTTKKIQDRVVFIQSLDMDWMGSSEDMRLDEQGYFLFNFSQEPIRPLVRGIPLTVDMQDQQKPLASADRQLPQSSKPMPLVILVPNPRGSYSSQVTALSFISIVKALMSIAVLSQSKNKNLQADGEKISQAKEWDIRLTHQGVTFSQLEKKQADDDLCQNKDDEYDTTCTSTTQVGDHKLHKQMQSFHSLNNNQNSFEINQAAAVRTPSASSEDRGKLQVLTVDVEQLTYQLSDKFFHSVHWHKFFDYVYKLQESKQTKSSFMGMKLLSTNLFWRFQKNQLAQQEALILEKKQRMEHLRKVQVKLNASQPLLQTHTQQTSSQAGNSSFNLATKKIFTDIYDILKDQRANGNPLSNMMNRNLRVFDQVNSIIKQQVNREIGDWDRAQSQRAGNKYAQISSASAKDLEKQDIVSRIVVLGLDDPQAHFKTLQTGFERYAVVVNQIHQDKLDGGGELDLDQNYRKISIMRWLNSQGNSAVKKRQQASLGAGGAAAGGGGQGAAGGGNSNTNKRPSSVSSAGGEVNIKMMPLNSSLSASKVKQGTSAKKDPSRNLLEERCLGFIAQSLPSPHSEVITITVIPCGREDGKNSEDEMPYEIKIRKKANENSLKEIFLRKSSYWEKIFKQHLEHEIQPNFSIYRKPFEIDQDPSKSDLFLHILYMKSSEKALTRNYNAQELELFCHNRFYGPLVVAYNLNKQPYYLVNFSLMDLTNIEQINRNFQNKSIKDDYVPDCLMNFEALHENLDELYAGSIEIFQFYMFKYKSSWCPNKKDSHDSKSCIYAHHTRDFRRPPDIFKYLAEDCETLIKGLGWDKCDKGLKCSKCHTTVERLYHPDKYKRIFCDKSRCNKQEICAFYHTHKERQKAAKECQNYRRIVAQRGVPSIDRLHEQLSEYYKHQNSQQQQQQTLQVQAAPYRPPNLLNRQVQNTMLSTQKQLPVIPTITVANEDGKDLKFDSDSSESNIQLLMEDQQHQSSLTLSNNDLKASQPITYQRYSGNLDTDKHFGPSHRIMSHNQLIDNTQNALFSGNSSGYINHPQPSNHQMNIGSAAFYMNTPQKTSTSQSQYSHQRLSEHSALKRSSPLQSQDSPPMNYHQIQMLTSGTGPNNQQAYPNFIEQRPLSQTIVKQSRPGQFYPQDQDGLKTKSSTFSIFSEDKARTSGTTATTAREEIKKHVQQIYYEQAFATNSQSIGFLNPVDNDELAQSPQNHPSLGLNKQPSLLSPNNFLSPVILDFLEDDTFFNKDEKRIKSRTEIVKRERQHDSDEEEFQFPNEAENYLNSILPNNSIQFKKHSESRFSFSSQKKI